MINYTDDTKAVIVGGEWFKYQLFYDGRPQSQRLHAYTEQQAEDNGKALFEQVKAECGKAFDVIYPLNAWEVRIWQPT